MVNKKLMSIVGLFLVFLMVSATPAWAACTLSAVSAPQPDDYISGNAYDVTFSTAEGAGGTCAADLAEFEAWYIYDAAHDGFANDAWITIDTLSPAGDLASYSVPWDTTIRSEDYNLYYKTRITCKNNCAGGPIYVGGADTNTFGIDNTAPLFSSAYTADSNANGILDNIVVVFNEQFGMDQSITDTTGWSLTANDGENAYTIDAISWMNATHMYINISEEATHLTDVGPTAVYDGTGTIADLAGNALAAGNSGAAVDMAAPAPIRGAAM